MNNELLLIATVFINFGSLIIMYKLFNKIGVYIWIALAIVLANIEVVMLIEAFGREMTLGNVMFASSFLATDLLSEKFSKKEANHAVTIGLAASLVLIVVSQVWLQFTPSINDSAYASLSTIFGSTPRIVLAGIIVYVIVQFIDIRIYHIIWNITKKWHSDEKKYLWLRNNGSTIFSQFINAFLFTYIAFYNGNVIPNDSIFSIALVTFVIYVVISLLDTPFMYLARSVKPREFS